MDYEHGAQLASQCRLEWGYEGTRRAAARQDIVVVVDTLRFSTAAVVAVARGAIVHVEGEGDSPRHPDQWDTLSPASYETMDSGAHVTLRSPNGATCCHHGKRAPYLFVAALINARAAAQAVIAVLAGRYQGVSVIACGERHRLATADGPLRFAIEDYLGAGSILSYLGLPKSAEAQVCQAAFEATRDNLPTLLHDSTSGWELRHKGRVDDVQYAARLNAVAVVPMLTEETLHAFPRAT
jgi:2-phosphosulfolactate phosphatase